MRNAHTVRFVLVSFIYISIVLSSQWQQATAQKKILCCLSVHYENEMQINDERREEEKLNLSLDALRFIGFIRPNEICEKKIH